MRRALPAVRPSGDRARPSRPAARRRVAPLLEPEAEIYAALCLGVRDYVAKNGFEHVVLGLSGGIDSTLVALIAADALGADRVTAVVMPSRYSSEGTQSDARALAANLGVECLDIPIAPAMEVYEQMLAQVFADREPDITEENLQARIRGNLLMALSNKFGWLVLTTGNKSENSVGYSTLYGDSAGGFAVIKDVPKTLVYRLVDFRNAHDGGASVPRSIIDRPPSAELRPDQKDADSLPDYDMLDAILEAYSSRTPARALALAGLPERRSSASSRSSTGPSTSAARRRPGSRSRRARSAATGGCRSRTPTARASARRHPAEPPRQGRGHLRVEVVAERDAGDAQLRQPRDRRVPGAQQDVDRRPSATNAAIVASSATPIG